MTVNFHDSDDYTDQVFDNLVFPGIQLEGKRFSDCTFKQCNFSEVVFLNCKFDSCTFLTCDLSLIQVDGSSFKETTFKNSRLVGVNWTRAKQGTGGLLHTRTVAFVQCVLNFSTFIGVKLRETKLLNCTAREVDFEEADLTGSDCRNSDFARSRFARTNLTAADLRGASNYEIDANLNKLSKTKFSLPEAMSLLYSLDIILEE